MPAIWQSSQRPMYVRTVWVDGFRHAILTTDDPHLKKLRKKRPYSSNSYVREQKGRESRLSFQEEGLAGCVRQFNFVITSEKSRTVPQHTFESSVEQLNLKDIDRESEEEFVLKSKPQPLYEFESTRSKYNTLDMRTFRSNRTATSDVKENSNLSDRVLQWLDLAGKVDLLAPENEATRMSQPRHSWPEIQRRNLTKSKTAVDLKCKEPKGDSPKESADSERGVIDRYDFYVPAPANTIENYARQSRNAKGTPRDSPCAPKPDNLKIKARDLRRNVQETRQRVVSERHAVHKQYAELVSRKILPDYGKPKKQVHIFIPEAVPNKNGSLLSQSSKCN